MNPNLVVRSSVTGLTLLEKNLIEREYRYKIFPTYSNAEQMEESFNTATNFAIALQASTFALNMVLSKTL